MTIPLRRAERSDYCEGSVPRIRGTREGPLAGYRCAPGLPYRDPGPPDTHRFRADISPPRQQASDALRWCDRDSALGWDERTRIQREGRREHREEKRREHAIYVSPRAYLFSLFFSSFTGV